MLIIALLVFGLATGWVAQWLIGRSGRAEVDWTQTFVAGLAGSFVGGLLSSLLSGDGLALRPSGIIGSIAGAVIVLLVWNRVSDR